MKPLLGKTTLICPHYIYQRASFMPGQALAFSGMLWAGAALASTGIKGEGAGLDLLSC
jgi:hypothetical protein